MKIMRPSRASMLRALLATIVSSFFLLPSASGQGALTPPGPPAPTLKTLDQVQPRIPISSVPAIVSNPGSYYLTTNLTGVASQYGIAVLADNVTIDLNGFALAGVNNSFAGVAFFGQKNLCIRNGVIRDWPQGGIGAFPSSDCRFENLMVTGNSFQSGSGGIQADANALVLHCQVFSNNLSGISVGRGSTVRECNVSSSGIGISAGDACVLAECTAISNSNGGVSLGNGCVMSDCTAVGNSTNGITAAQNCTLRDCVARLNTGRGISTSSGALLTACNASSNQFSGFNVGSGSTLDHCLSQANAADGIDTGDGSTLDSCTSKDNRGVNTRGIFVGNNCRVSGANVSGNGWRGLDTGYNAVVIGSSVSSNFNGINISSDSTLKDCTAVGNYSVGIGGGNGNTVADCTVVANGDAGIWIGSACTVVHCTAMTNRQFGIYVTVSTVKDCTTVANTGEGIEADADSTVSGCTAIGNSGNGISVIDRCRVMGNLCNYNGQAPYTNYAGIQVFGSNCRVEDNHTEANNGRGILIFHISHRNLVIKNSAKDNFGLDFDLVGAGDNNYGQVIATPGANFVNSNPWANFAF